MVAPCGLWHSEPGKEELQEILNLSPADLARLVTRLTYHAWWKMRRLTWRGAYVSRGGAVPEGFEPGDFVNDAIQKTLNGERKWNKAEYKTLESFLRSVVNSDISHLVESIDNQQGRRLSPPPVENETVAEYEIFGTEPNPLKVVIDRNWKAKFHADAMNELAGEEFLIKLLECMEADIAEPSEIAEYLEVTVDHVNNEKKRLRRRLEKLDTRMKPTKKGKAR